MSKYFRENNKIEFRATEGCLYDQDSGIKMEHLRNFEKMLKTQLNYI